VMHLKDPLNASLWVISYNIYNVFFGMQEKNKVFLFGQNECGAYRTSSYVLVLI